MTYKMDTGYKKDTIPSHETCQRAVRAIRDTLDVVGDKWKLVLLMILMHGKRRFRELSREAGISPRVLSKELQEMEMNGLISRTVQNTRPMTVEYAATPYSETLKEVLMAMEHWGQQHRNMIMGKG